MRHVWSAVFLAVFHFLLATAINPNELKPCFERYDGFKIVNAVPFHSEWRMKAEEWCLEFCVRASSRCISIVYDKHSHICHYFNVNGIESEKIAKQPRMVYFQIAEKQCAEKMQNRIEQDDYWRNINYLRQQQQEANETVVAALPARSEEAKSPEEQQVSGEQRTTGTPVVDENLPLMSQENPQMAVETPRSYPIGVDAEQTADPTEATTRANEAEEAERDVAAEEDGDFDGDPMSFVRRYHFEKELEEVGRSTGLFAAGDPNGLGDKTLVKVNGEAESTFASSEFPSTPSTTSTTLEPTTTSTTEPPPTTTTTTTEAPTTTTESTTMRTTESTTTSTLPPTTTTTTTTEQPTTSTTEGIAMKSLMTGFKAVRRPLPVKAELEEKKTTPGQFMTEVRRSPVRSFSAAPPTAAEGEAEDAGVAHRYTGRRPFAQRMDESAQTTRKSEELTKEEDDESLLAANNPVVDDCSEGMQEVWLAVENSQVNSSVRTSVIKLAAQPLECMESCQSLFIGKHPCDSFTFNEPAKRCIFHSSHAGFQVKPSGTNDFSTRAFRRFCFAESLTPFSDCSEFLAFRNYQLEITPREMFEDLPTGNEGISACIELCVLSHEFRCKSASFNTQTGSCWIYDEHSLSKPTAFKEAPNSDRLYFENGCIEMPIPAEARKQAKVQRIEPTVLDYRKLSKL